MRRPIASGWSARSCEGFDAVWSGETTAAGSMPSRCPERPVAAAGQFSEARASRR